MKKGRLPFDILHEDRDVLVIDKPAGLLTTHTRVAGRIARETQLTAENLLNGYVRKGQSRSRNRVWLVHRLDRETSGVMMFAKSEAVSEYFRSGWNALTEKTYLARVSGIIAEDHGFFESFLREDPDGYRVRSVDPGKPAARMEKTASRPPSKKARTEWRTLERTPANGDHPASTLVEIKLKSGRKNQIRVHFSEAGHPVVGDVKYGGPAADRLYLHSLRLRFVHPHTGCKLEFTAPCKSIGECLK